MPAHPSLALAARTPAAAASPLLRLAAAFPDTHPQNKVHVEVHNTELVVTRGGSKGVITKTPGSMITWAGYSEAYKAMAFVDTCEMPAVVHVVKFKSNGAAAYRYAMHKVRCSFSPLPSVPLGLASPTDTAARPPAARH